MRLDMLLALHEGWPHSEVPRITTRLRPPQGTSTVKDRMMAAYAKQGENIVLLLSLGEAMALRDAAQYADESGYFKNQNNSQAKARARATRALEVACERSSRSGARID